MRFDLCLAQSADDAARYAGLGAPRYLTTGNLKLDAPPPSADADKLRALQDVIGMRPVIAATSTHPGEEEILAETGVDAISVGAFAVLPSERHL